jgi:dTDP-4-amino-4,6-dideoxygalactose transaminase
LATGQDHIPFAIPDIGEDDIAEVVEALRNGWLTTGPKTRKFEADFAAAVAPGSEAVSVNSATAGLHLALEAIGVGPGDEVITTTYTFTASGEVVRYLGAHPVFVDIEAGTLNLDASKLEAAITPRTKAIIPVHFAGLACDMDAVLKIARRHNIKVIEDAAHAYPTYHRGKMVGDLGSDASVFSFYATKTLPTGEGCMVITRDAALAKRCRVMRLHGIDRDAFDRYTSKEASWRYDVVAPGYKYNLTDIASGIGLSQLKKTEPMWRRRQELASRYLKALEGSNVVLPPSETFPGDKHAWHLFVIRLGSKAKIGRDDFIQRMAKDFGVSCSVHFIPLHKLTYWKTTYNLTDAQFPVASAVFERSVSLPLYTRMTNAQQDRVIAAVKELAG